MSSSPSVPSTTMPPARSFDAKVDEKKPSKRYAMPLPSLYLYTAPSPQFDDEYNTLGISPNHTEENLKSLYL